MGVETITTGGVDGLNDDWPLEEETMAEGAAHIRTVKLAVKNQKIKNDVLFVELAETLSLVETGIGERTALVDEALFAIVQSADTLRLEVEGNAEADAASFTALDVALLALETALDAQIQSSNEQFAVVSEAIGLIQTDLDAKAADLDAKALEIATLTADLSSTEAKAVALEVRADALETAASEAAERQESFAYSLSVLNSRIEAMDSRDNVVWKPQLVWSA